MKLKIGKLNITITRLIWKDATKFETMWLGFWLGAVFGASVAFVITVIG